MSGARLSSLLDESAQNRIAWLGEKKSTRKLNETQPADELVSPRRNDPARRMRDDAGVENKEREVCLLEKLSSALHVHNGKHKEQRQLF